MGAQNNPYRLDLSKYSTHHIIAKSVGSDRTVLDVGCNEGYIGSISDRSNIFFGLDCSIGCVEQAKKVYRDAVVYDLNKLGKLPWEMRFETLIMADILEHLLAPEEVLKFFIDAYLEKDGTIIISLPNIANWQIRLSLLLGSFEYKDTGILDRTHLKFYTFKSAIDLASRVGLSVKTVMGGASFFGPLLALAPLLKELLATNIILVAKIK